MVVRMRWEQPLAVLPTAPLKWAIKELVVAASGSCCSRLEGYARLWWTTEVGLKMHRDWVPKVTACGEFSPKRAWKRAAECVCVCVKVPLLYGVRAPNLANTSVPAARSQVESLLAVGCPGGRVPSFRIAKCAGTGPCSPLKHNKTSNHANTKSPKWIERIWKIQKCQKYVRRGVKCLQCKIARKQKPNQNCTAHCPRKIPEKKSSAKNPANQKR